MISDHPRMTPCTQFADSVLEIHDLSEFDAIEVHGVRTAGGGATEVMIDDESPERYSTYFRRISGEPVRCGDFSEEWAAQEYAAELSDQHNLPIVDFVLAAALGQEPSESTEHMSSPPGM